MQAEDFTTTRQDGGHDGPGPISGFGSVVLRVESSRTGGAYSLFEVEVEAGASSYAHVQHREDECLYVIDGDFMVTCDGAEIPAGRGDYVYVSKGVLHSYTNVGRTTGKLLALYTPGRAHEELLRELEPGHDVETTISISARYGVEIVRDLPERGPP